MITAKEARTLTKNTIGNRLERARTWATNELTYLENKIHQAIERGEFETSYWWSWELLKEASITIEEAKSALISILSNLGYNLDYEYWNCSKSENAFKIFISWDNKR